MPEEGTRHHDRRHDGFIVGRRVQADSFNQEEPKERIGLRTPPHDEPIVPVVVPGSFFRHR